MNKAHSNIENCIFGSELNMIRKNSGPEVNDMEEFKVHAYDQKR